ncbi:MAG: tRNA-intron lyase [Candidatus Bathyarchaeia archaeon]
MSEPQTGQNSKRRIVGNFVGDNIIVSGKEDVNSLLEGGYGVKKGESLLLQGYEALYLVAEKRLSVFNGNTELSFQDLLKRCQLIQGEVWSEFLLFRDLRDRGYVVRKGPVGEVGFRVYERGAYPKKAAKYLVLLLREGKPKNVGDLWNTMKLVQGMKKKLILAVMDRRGEIVYYSLDQFNPA